MLKEFKLNDIKKQNWREKVTSILNCFSFFSAHDTDENGSIDGLELLKAILHAKKSHEHQVKKAEAATLGGYADESGAADHIEESAPTPEEIETTAGKLGV